MSGVLPDAEKVLSAYLRSRDEVTDLVDQRVYTEIPTTPEWPLVRVTRVAGAPILDRPLYIDQALVQVDVWGGPKSIARQIAETCRAVLAEAYLASHDGAVICDAVFGSFQYEPDTAYEPAKPRYSFDVQITLHPN